VVHPQRGATSTNSSSSLLSSVNLLTCTEPQNPLRIGQEICAHLARSSFPELGHNTFLQAFLQSLALSSASSQHTVCTKLQSHIQHLASLALSTTSHTTYISLLLHHLTSPRFLFIHYKMGLNMGKTHGPTSHTHYINPKPKNPTKGGEIPRSPLRLALHLRPACRSPKIGQT
jgi:hypothetical protein